MFHENARKSNVFKIKIAVLLLFLSQNVKVFVLMEYTSEAIAVDHLFLIPKYRGLKSNIEQSNV